MRHLGLRGADGKRGRAIEHLERHDLEERRPFSDELDGLSHAPRGTLRSVGARLGWLDGSSP